MQATRPLLRCLQRRSPSWRPSTQITRNISYRPSPLTSTFTSSPFRRNSSPLLNQKTIRALSSSTDQPSAPQTGISTQQQSGATAEEPEPDKPAYELTFTCKPCGDRSTHRVSKQGYHKGTVLITCPSCKNRHVISDHLKIFSDTSMTIEDIMREKGEEIKKGSVSPNGDVEFY